MSRGNRASRPQSARRVQAQRGDRPLRIGISMCLLGENVRYDGGHKRDPFVTGVLSRFVQFVAVCPEMDIGLGIPREPIRLVDVEGRVRLRGVKSETDHTAAMQRYARRKTRELARLDLCGYILKKDSPSCGMERVRVHGAQGGVRRSGTGMFAATLIAAFPDLPVEEEGRLQDLPLRENFVERVFAYHRLRQLFAAGWKPGDLVRFHTAEKLLLLAHDPVTYRALGRLVAAVRARPRPEVESSYRTLWMQALRKRATPAKHCNVLQHILGHFRDCAEPADRRELEGLIEDFRHGLVPLVVPVTLVRHLVRVHDVATLQNQTYLEPHPKELMLRNHV